MQESDLLQQIEERDIIESCQELMRLRSINPPGEELRAAEYIAHVLEGAGLEVELIEHSPGRASTFARLRGSGRKSGLFFNGHIDTVPVGVETWLHDPFGGEIADGKIWGRGAADMKSGVVAQMMAMKILAQAKAPLQGDLMLAATAGEEINSLGATALASRTDIGPVQAIFIAEPSSNELYIAEKGAFWIEITTHGQTSHGSMPDLGRNAVMMMVHLLDEFEKLEIPFESHPLLGAFSRSVNTIAGGIKTNVVPDECVATVDMRTVPGQEHRMIFRKIEGLISELQKKDPALKASLRIMNDLPPLETPHADPNVVCFAEVISSITGKKIVPKGASYFTDGAVLVPALKAPLLICGPGNPDLAHQRNEHVEIDKLVESVKIYTLIASRLLG